MASTVTTVDLHLPGDFIPRCPKCEADVKEIIQIDFTRGFLARLKAAEKTMLCCPHCRSVLGFGSLTYT